MKLSLDQATKPTLQLIDETPGAAALVLRAHEGKFESFESRGLAEYHLEAAPAGKAPTSESRPVAPK